LASIRSFFQRFDERENGRLTDRAQLVRNVGKIITGARVSSSLDAT